MRVLAAFGSMVGVLAAVGATAQDDPVLKAMRDELTRSVEKLRIEKLDPPYFIAYTAPDRRLAGASASLGALLSSNESRFRSVSVELRVGSPSLDNTGFSSGFRAGGGATLPLDDDYGEMRRQIWLATDLAYKRALEELARKKAYLETKSRSDDSPDFSREEPTTLVDTAPPDVAGRSDLELLAKDLSTVFRDLPEIITSRVEVGTRHELTRYVNSEGTSFTVATPRVRLFAMAATQAADGTPLEDFVAVYGRSLQDLPSKEDLRRQVRDLATRLTRLRHAPNVETYNGPVLFEGQAAAELFAQVFAARLLAARPPLGDDRASAENPFLDRIGGRVLPEFLSVTDDPTRTHHEGIPLLGAYKIDDDGVRARENRLVEKGILKTLLSTRSPVRGFPKSSGSRRGNAPMPSNLFVTASASLGPAEMKEALLKEVRERGSPYGLVVRRLGNPVLASRPFGRTGSRSEPGGTRVESATVVAKVFPDGSEEALRLAEIVGLTPESFKEIVAASRDVSVQSMPIFVTFPWRSVASDMVSVVIPSVLFKEVSLKKPSGEFSRPPVASHPLLSRK